MKARGLTGGRLELDGELYATTGQIAERMAHAGVTASVVRNWRNRGLILPVGVLGRENVYAMRDVWAAEKKTRPRTRRKVQIDA